MGLGGLVWIPPRPSAEEHWSHWKWPAPLCIWAQKAKLTYLDGVLPQLIGGQPGPHCATRKAYEMCGLGRDDWVTRGDALERVTVVLM